MKKLVVTLALVICLSLLVGETTPCGKKSPCPEAGALSIGDILEQVYIRLNRAEKTAVPMLDTDTADELSQMMTEIYSLLELLPKDTVLSSDNMGEDCAMEPGDTSTNEKPDKENPKLKPRLTPVPDRYPISDEDFDLLTFCLKQEPLRKDRLAMIKASAETHRYSAEQIITLLSDCLIFNSDRLEALKDVYPALVDPENKVSILMMFSTENAQVKAGEIME